MTKEEITSQAIVENIGQDEQDSALTMFSVKIQDSEFKYGIGIDLEAGKSRLDGLSEKEQFELVISENLNDIYDKLNQ
jgi:hypothetical protein